MAFSSFCEKTSEKISMKACSSASVFGGPRLRRAGSSVQVMSIPICGGQELLLLLLLGALMAARG